MVWVRRRALRSDIHLRRKASSPKRTGTRMISLFLKAVGLSSCSMTLLMSNLRAFEPMSMAANLRMIKSGSYLRFQFFLIIAIGLHLGTEWGLPLGPLAIGIVLFGRIYPGLDIVPP